MDTRTGEVIPMEEVFKKPKEEQKHFIEIPEADRESVMAMNRHERRRWLKQHRKNLKRGR